MNMDRALDWDDEIEQDSGEFILLPPGEYDFIIQTYERGRFEGSANMIACNMAKVIFLVTDPKTGQQVTVNENLFLNSNSEWKLSAFFRSIGEKQEGERVKMNWPAVPGATGRFELNQRTFKSKKTGEDITVNNVKKFIPKENSYSAPSQQQQYQQPAQPQQQQINEWQTGTF